jgi:hypothetical protein
MSEQPPSPPGLQVFEARVYFDPKTGEVISAHQVVGSPGESLGSDQVQTEMNDFEESLRQRHPAVDFIVVDPQDLRESSHGMKVDIETRSIVWPIDNGG